jgi:hypothetical protein
MFIWRLAHNSLPVRRNLAQRGVKTDTICPVCHRLDEDSAHLFFKCKKARECWRAMDLEHICAELELCISGKDAVIRILKLKQIEQHKIFILLWRWWSARNKINAGDKMATTAEIGSSVSFYLMKFEELANNNITSKDTAMPRW